MLHGRACPVAEVDGGRRLSCAGEGSLQRCIGSYRLTLDRVLAGPPGGVAKDKLIPRHAAQTRYLASRSPAGRHHL